MKDRVKEIYNDASLLLKENMEHQNKQIDYILINPKNEDLWVMCSDGVDTAIELHYRDGMMKNNYFPEWDFNFDYYVYNLLEDIYTTFNITFPAYLNLNSYLNKPTLKAIDFKDVDKVLEELHDETNQKNNWLIENI